MLINKKIFFFEKIPSFIIILMPALLVSGPFLSDLGVSIIALLFLINSIKNNLYTYYKNYYFKTFLVFWIILIVSSLLSENIVLSLKNSFFYIRFGLFSLCFWYLLDRNKKILIYLFYSILICFMCLIIDGYIQSFIGKNLLGWKIDGSRASSFFGSELILGSYIARFFPILFGLFIFVNEKLKLKNKKLLFFITIIFILAEGLIVLSAERSALFFMNFSAIFIILMVTNYKKYRFWTYIVSLFLILGIIFFFPQTKDRIIDKTISEFVINSEDQTKKFYIFTKAHNDMYLTGLNIFNDHKSFGVGPGQFRYICKKYEISNLSCQSHPHNTYIEILADTGIFAFLIVFGVFLFIIFLCLVQFLNSLTNYKKKYFNDFQLCLLSAFLISLWPFVPTGSFFNNWMSIVYYFPVGIFMWQRFDAENSIKRV